MTAAEVDVAIVGAGVIGLAIASEIGHPKRAVLVLEKNSSFGLATSSRNSEVIHAGIYYPKNSLKAKLCVEGKHLLYELCQRCGIPYRRLGKIVVAVSDGEISQLERLCEQGKENGVEDLRLLTRTEVKKLEPNVEARAGLLSPSTGILDSYSLLKFLYHQAREKTANFVFDTEVVGIERTVTKYRVRIRDREGVSEFTSRVIVNAAGLNSDKIAELAGIDVTKAGYRLHYCKGEYFSLSPKYKRLLSRLVYPVPEEAGHGIHVTLALDGRIRLGPNARYVGAIDYSVDDTQKSLFYDSVRRFFPALEWEELQPEFAGIRPKLQGPGEVFRDFVVTHEDKAGLPGLINLIGIESPGLTASLAIARRVGKMVDELLA